MSKKPDMEQIPVQEEEEQSGGLLLWLLLGILLVMLLGGGLAIASFLGIISLDSIIDKTRQLPQKIAVIEKVEKYFSAPSPAEQTETGQGEGVNVPSELPLTLPINAALPSDNGQKPAVPQETPESIAKAKAEAAKNISHLARLYGSMKAEEAVLIMEELDDELNVTILRKMEDEQAAKILSVMNPQRAAKLSRMLAGKQRTVIQVN